MIIKAKLPKIVRIGVVEYDLHDACRLSMADGYTRPASLEHEPSAGDGGSAFISDQKSPAFPISPLPARCRPRA